MGAITLFLLVLIAALLAGHFLLYATKPKGMKKGRETRQNYFFEPMEKEIEGGKAMPQGPSSAKISLLNERLDRLERILLSPEGLSPASVKHRLDSVESFKSNAEVEIQGIKEVLFELSGKQKEIRKTRSTGKAMEQKLHKIIYRSN